MEKTEKNLQTAIVLNALVICFVIYSSIFNLIDDGWGFFKYYTELSNVFGGITSAICLHYFIHKKKDSSLQIPEWCTELKFFAVSCLMLTFLVVVFVLAPEKGGWYGYRTMLFGKTSICTHFLTPITITVSFLCFEKEPLTKSYYRAIIPTVIYAVVILILNIAKVLVGPYFFLHVYEQSVIKTIFWTILLMVADALIALNIGSIKKKLLTR